MPVTGGALPLRYYRGTLKILFWLLVLATPAWGKAAVLHHELAVQLLVSEQTLVATDRLTVEPGGADRLSFHLAPNAEIGRVTVKGGDLAWDFADGRLRIKLPPALRTGAIALQIDYRAVFADQAPASPLNTEDPSYGVTATISPHGAFLGGSAGWYPQLPGSLPTFRLQVEAPGMLAVSSGRLIEAVPGRTVWESSKPGRALALAAGPYTQHTAKAGEVPVYAFFYPQSSDLAATYLQAATGYLQLYQELFGPYPFAKFAVAENFFPTGYGFPSWTLLGSTVVRLPFIVETSLGHEIAHCWWGNGVWVDYRQGNWSEGLTTYVAEHLYQERQSPEAAREHRLKILRDYASLVPPAGGIPLSAFVSRTTAAEQAIGYGKAAMVFHMARQQIGDAAFWQGLRQVAEEKLFAEAAWSDFAAAFGQTGKTGLGDFFRQWVQRPGAPVLRLEEVQTSTLAGGGWRVSGVLRQEGERYLLPVPLRLETAGGEEEIVLESRQARTLFNIETATEPRRLVVDPEVHLFRRLDPAEIPPTVNGIKGSTGLLVVAAEGLSANGREAAGMLLQGLGQAGARIVPETQVAKADLQGHDLLFVGWPTRTELLPTLPAELRVEDGMITLEGEKFRRDETDLFAALPHPTQRGRVAALFLSASPTAATTARKLPHYGKYSYLVFTAGNNVAKGTWPVKTSPVIHEFTAR